MAVYTKLSESDLKVLFSKYNLGKLINFEEIKEGIENTNYFVELEKGKFILSQRYTNIRYRTPGIHYETKLFTKIFAIAISVSVSVFVVYYVSPLFREFLNLPF